MGISLSSNVSRQTDNMQLLIVLASLSAAMAAPFFHHVPHHFHPHPAYHGVHSAAASMADHLAKMMAASEFAKSDSAASAHGGESSANYGTHDESGSDSSSQVITSTK